MQDMALPRADEVRRRLSPVWLVPGIALVIALAMGLRAWQQQGTHIDIVFAEAGGMEVGKTSVRLKEVPVGKVVKMALSQDLRQVIATVAIDRAMSQHLSENTRFWLVQPRVSTSGISNLGTLVSGVYIVMDPGAPGPDKSRFEGLNEPPAVQSDDKGTQYVLKAATLGALDIGSPVYYRELRVGEVISYQLAADGQSVEARIFVKEPYDRLVASSSRFWNVSGFDVSLGMEGVTAEMTSLSSLVLGGVAFDSPGFSAGSKAVPHQRFRLFDSRASAETGALQNLVTYRLRFSHSVKGLKVGAPVEFRGLPVGEVQGISMQTPEPGSGQLEVVIGMAPALWRPDITDKPAFDQLLRGLMAKGLRAELKSQNPLLGGQYIEWRYLAPETAPWQAAPANEPLEYLASLDRPPDALLSQLESLAAAAARLPLDALGRDLSASAASLKAILGTLETQKTAQHLHNTLVNTDKATAELSARLAEARVTLAQLTQTLKSVDHAIAPDSQMHAEFIDTLNAVAEASDSFDRFVEELYRYPSSLVFGLKKEEAK
jgi:paraquat-inducible protein B